MMPKIEIELEDVDIYNFVRNLTWNEKITKENVMKVWEENPKFRAYVIDTAQRYVSYDMGCDEITNIDNWGDDIKEFFLIYSEEEEVDEEE
jgi:hypothetical protein